jgi:hypothetical protein
MTLASIVHLVLHAAAPGAVAWFFFRTRWRRAWLIMLATMLVDLDHLLADPVYDPNRCGIGFHPLHTAPAIAGYAVLSLLRPARLIGVGLLVHMALDLADCGVIAGAILSTESGKSQGVSG